MGNENLVKHMIACGGACMKALASRCGGGDEAEWELAGGLLHDIDYDSAGGADPARHSLEGGAKMLEDDGC